MTHNRVETENGIRPYGPGKFDTMIDAYVYALTLNGGCDDETSDSRDGYGGTWYGRMSLQGGQAGYACADSADLTADEWTLLLNTAGVVVSEDSQGFVSVEYCDTTDELNDMWARVVSVCSEGDDDE